MIVRVARAPLALKLLAVVAFLVIPAFLLTTPPLALKVIGGIAALWGVMTFANLTFQITSPRHVIVVDELGIEDIRTGIGTIPWPAITSLEIRDHFGTPNLCVEYAESGDKGGDSHSSAIAPMSTNNRTLWIPLKGLSPSAARLRSHLLNNHAGLIGGDVPRNADSIRHS